MTYRIVSISNEIASEVRNTLVSPQYRSLVANVSIANGYGPCRSCLRVFNEGKDYRIYFTYNSFEGRSNLPDPGPIFIHREECERFADQGFPPDIIDLPVFFEAFGDESKLVSRQKMDKATLDSQIENMFADSGVRFINLRNAEAGCFIARVERV